MKELWSSSDENKMVLQKQIDTTYWQKYKLVYELYGLTEEEIVVDQR